MSIFCAACSNDNGDNSDDTTPKPVTSALKTYVFDNEYKEVAKLVVDRMTNKATILDESVKTVIIPASSVSSISDDDYKKIAKIFSNNGNIVLVEPTVSQWNGFITGVFLEYNDLVFINKEIEFSTEMNNYVEGVFDFYIEQQKELSKNPDAVEQAVLVGNMGKDNPDEHFCDMIVVRGMDLHIVADLNDAEYYGTSMTTEEITYTYNEDGTLKEKTVPVKGTENAIIDESVASDLDFGDFADIVLNNLNEQPNSKNGRAALIEQGATIANARGIARDAASVSDIKDIMSAQRFWYTLPVAAPLNIDRVGSATFSYTVWAVCDISKQTDYYIMHQNIISKNAGLYYESGEAFGEDEFHNRYDDGKKIWAVCGGYLKNINVKVKLYEGQPVGNTFPTESAGATIESYSPSTDINATQYTSGINWSVNGELGTGGIGVQGGVSFSDSTTRNVSDLSITVNSGNDGAESIEWNFGGTGPVGIGGLTLKHSLVPAILRNDCYLDTYWVWKVENSSGKQYTFSPSLNFTAEALGSISSGFMWLSHTDKYYQSSTKQTCYFRLTPPSRASQKWHISYSVKDDKGNVLSDDLDSFLARNYNELGNEQYFTVYAPDNEDRKVIKNFIDNLHGKFKNTANNWISHGHNKIYTFEFRTGDQYQTLYSEGTFTFDPNNPKDVK